LPFLSSFVTYFNIEKMLSRMTALLEMFQFAPMRTVLDQREELRL